MRLLFNNAPIFAGLLFALLAVAGQFFNPGATAINLIVSAVIASGVLLFASGSMDKKIRAEAGRLTLDSLRHKVMASQSMVDEIQKLAGQTPDTQARKKLLQLCEVSRLIFRNFQQDPRDITKSGRFILYLERILPMARHYVRVASTPQGRELLKERSEDEAFLQYLDTAIKGFNQGFKNYLDNDVVELKRLGTVVTRMMDVAEIGK